MNTISANPTLHEHMQLRDGIFYYSKLSRRHGAITLAAPKRCVEVVHRAERRRIRWGSGHESFAFFMAVMLIPFAIEALIGADAASWFRTTGFVFLLVVYCASSVIRWPLLRGMCQTELLVTTDRRKFRIVFNYVQGKDPELELFLDHLQRCEPEWEGRHRVRGCVVEFAESKAYRIGFSGYAVGCLIMGSGLLMDYQENLTFGTLVVLVGVGIVLMLLLSAVIDLPFSRIMRTARGALLDGDLDTAALILRKVVERKPYHFYANYLLTAHAVISGDLDAAAHHRAAMNGNSGRERLSVIATDLTHTVSSAPAFRALSDYAHGGGEARLDVLEKVSP
jgi:hypothetical protein